MDGDLRQSDFTLTIKSNILRTKMTGKTYLSLPQYHKNSLIFKALLIILTFGLNAPVSAQNKNTDTIKILSPPSPVIIGSIIGNNGVHLQTIFLKTFNPSNRFGIFGLADMYGVYKTDEQVMRNQQMAQTQLTYRIVKGLNVSAGAFFETHSGFRPTAGLQYNLFAGDFHLLLAPRIDLSQTYNGEILGIVEYTPKIKNNWRLYSLVQCLYNQDLKNDIHSVSYVWGKLGVSYKNYRFGVGGNFYSLGPKKIKENNYGLFLGVLLF